uniref:RIC3 domain-containing protein n=1 Tax=Syphacia muris TaxID=451379 RepID=A0A0N5AVY4_9BILA
MPRWSTESIRLSFCFRRRRYASEDEESPIPMWKVGLVIAVIVLCFAMLYPTLLRPFFASYFSPPPPQPKHKSSGRPPILPSMVGSRFCCADIIIYAGIRMAGAQGQGSTGGSASKGMLAWFLPIYTVGVVSFLLYTLFKSKKKKRRHRRKYSSEESDSDGLDEIDGYDSGKKKLQSLQERLKQTEIAMEKILLQLGAITNEQRESSSNEPSQPEATKEGKNEKYLKELEKVFALSDFKKLSQKHNIKSKRKKAALNDDTSTDDNTEDDIYERDSEVEKEKPMKKTSESTNEDQQAENSENKSGTTDDMKKKFRQHKKLTTKTLIFVSVIIDAYVDISLPAITTAFTLPNIYFC